MPIKYKIDMLAALKDAGYNTTRLRREKLLSESTIQALRIGKMVSLENITYLLHATVPAWGYSGI